VEQEGEMVKVTYAPPLTYPVSPASTSADQEQERSPHTPTRDDREDDIEMDVTGEAFMAEEERGDVAVPEENDSAIARTADGTTAGSAADASTSSVGEATTGSGAMVPTTGSAVSEGTTSTVQHWYLGDWRIQLTSFLFYVLRHLKRKGHVGTTAEDLRQLKQFIPPPILGFKPLSIVLAVTEGVTTVFREWERMTCRIPIPEGPRSTQHADVFPGELDPACAHGLFGLNQLILRRLLAPALPESFEQVRATKDDLIVLAGTKTWLVDVILEIFIHVRNHQEFWGLLLPY